MHGEGGGGQVSRENCAPRWLDHDRRFEFIVAVPHLFQNSFNLLAERCGFQDRSHMGLDEHLPQAAALKRALQSFVEAVS